MTKEKTKVLITVEMDEEKGVCDLTVGATAKDKDEVITCLLLALGQSLSVDPEAIVGAMLKEKVLNITDEDADELLKELEEDKKFDGCTGCGECEKLSTQNDADAAIDEIKSQLGLLGENEDDSKEVDVNYLCDKLDKLLDLCYEKLEKHE